MTTDTSLAEAAREFNRWTPEEAAKHLETFDEWFDAGLIKAGEDPSDPEHALGRRWMRMGFKIRASGRLLPTGEEPVQS